jgi:hypothetical protein
MGEIFAEGIESAQIPDAISTRGCAVPRIMIS